MKRVSSSTEYMCSSSEGVFSRRAFAEGIASSTGSGFTGGASDPSAGTSSNVSFDLATRLSRSPSCCSSSSSSSLKAGQQTPLRSQPIYLLDLFQLQFVVLRAIVINLPVVLLGFLPGVCQFAVDFHLNRINRNIDGLSR